ncbi:MAG: hypothetical protein MR529_10610 [Cuneatibacter sp.]|nr:hypothetical protein [Cuneatibacter sp.]
MKHKTLLSEKHSKVFFKEIMTTDLRFSGMAGIVFIVFYFQYTAERQSIARVPQEKISALPKQKNMIGLLKQ